MIRTVASFKVDFAELTGLPLDYLHTDGGRSYKATQARFLAMYLARQLVRVAGKRISYRLLAERFGYADHTTVLYGLRKVERRRRRDPVFNRLVELLLVDLG